MWGLKLTPIQTCAIVSLVCGIWNLFGDICFMDFSYAFMKTDSFGVIDDEPRFSNLFNFNKDWSLLLSQAGGWMYPIWAMVTIYPLYLGLENFDVLAHNVLPCALLAYGLCVVGGNLHSGYAFATILPQVLYNQNINRNDDGGELDELYSIVDLAQSKIMRYYIFGYTPGPLAVMVASGWIIYIVLKKETKFPRWFALCTPIVTMVWVNLIGFLMPSPWGFYFAGTFGTWIILVMNAAASWVLWNVNYRIILQTARGSYHEMGDAY